VRAARYAAAPSDIITTHAAAAGASASTSISDGALRVQPGLPGRFAAVLIFDREVEYDEIREVLKEQSVCKGVIEIPRVVIKEVPKIIEIKQVVEREKIVYIKTAEVQSEEALYNAKLERQRQCLKATRCALSLSLLQPLLARQAYLLSDPHVRSLRAHTVLYRVPHRVLPTLSESRLLMRVFSLPPTTPAPCADSLPPFQCTRDRAQTRRMRFPVLLSRLGLASTPECCWCVTFAHSLTMSSTWCLNQGTCFFL
jgi:hypothetical protein